MTNKEFEYHGDIYELLARGFIAGYLPSPNTAEFVAPKPMKAKFLEHVKSLALESGFCELRYDYYAAGKGFNEAMLKHLGMHEDLAPDKGVGSGIVGGHKIRDDAVTGEPTSDSLGSRAPSPPEVEHDEGFMERWNELADLVKSFTWWLNHYEQGEIIPDYVVIRWAKEKTIEEINEVRG